MTVKAIREYRGPGFILSAGRITEVGEPRMSTPPRVAASAAPAKRTKAPDLNPGKFYAARRAAVLSAAPADMAEPENIFAATAVEGIYQTRRSA